MRDDLQDSQGTCKGAREGKENQMNTVPSRTPFQINKYGILRGS